MKNILFLSIISIVLLTGCSSKSPDIKEEYKPMLSKVYLNTPKEKAVFYIDNSKDIKRVENLYNDLKSLLNKNTFSIKYTCSFKKSTDEKVYSYFNDTYTVINGGYILQECNKLDKPITYDTSFITLNDKKITFKQVISDEKKLDLYVNFLMYLYTEKIDDKDTLTSKYNLSIPFSLNLDSFKNDSLILDDEFLSLFSIKKQLIQLLVGNNYKVTDNISEATVKIELENIVFGNNNTVDESYHPLIIREKRSKSTRGGLITGSSGNLVLDSIALTFNIIHFSLFIADVLEDVVDHESTFLYTINKCKITENSNTKEIYLNTYIGKKYGTNILRTSVINNLNLNVSNHLVKYRLQHSSQKQESIKAKNKTEHDKV